MMKKVLVLFFIGAVCCSMPSCKKKNKDDQDQGPVQELDFGDDSKSTGDGNGD